MKLRLTDKSVYVIAVLNSLLLILIWNAHICIDTSSYISAWDNSWSKGIIDELRTPIYPLFLGLLKAISVNHFYTIAIIIQHCIFLTSVFYFKRILEWNIKSETVVRWITLLYAVLPATSTWASCILTECFAISGVVFLFYNLLKFERHPSVSSVIWSTIWLAFLVFLRPAFLYLIPACLIAWALFFKKNIILSLCGIAGVVIVSVSECVYCEKFEDRYGIFAPSSVGVINQSWMAFRDGLVKSEYTDNLELKEYIESADFSDPDTYVPTIDKYGLTTMASVVDASKRDQPVEWIRKVLGRFYQASQFPFLAAYAGYTTITDMIGININSLYLFLIVFSVILVVTGIRKRKIYQIPTLLLLTILGNLVTAVIGAQNEWGRLLLPSLPLFIVLVGRAINYIKIVRDEE